MGAVVSVLQNHGEKIFGGRVNVSAESLRGKVGAASVARIDITSDAKVIVDRPPEIFANFTIAPRASLDIVLLVTDCKKTGINLEFSLKNFSRLKCLFLVEGCKNSNISATATLEGENSNSSIGIFFHGENSDSHVFSVTQTHNAANSTSNVASKTILDGASSAEFNGFVNIAETAENCDAVQINGNILLSETAKATSFPTLNILNNSVKCSHGATTGSIDDATIFYMMSRGIDLQTCKLLAIDGAAAELLNKF
jgi:hypothetical protein